MKISTSIAVVVALLIAGGAFWYYSSMRPGILPAGETGINGSPNQGNTGQPPAVAQTPADGPITPPSIPQSNYILHTNTSSDVQLGTYLVALNGMTLYRFTDDTPNVSNCTGQCPTNWPPYTVPSQEAVEKNSAPDIVGKVSTITLPNGSYQVTYNSQPLYYFSGDDLPGKTNGQGVNARWFVVKP